MEISEGISIVDLGLKIGDVLVIGDLHIGFEEALNKQGVMVPRFQFRDIARRVENILKQARPRTIVVNGDIKHEFGRISDQEWRETLKILDILLKDSRKVVLIKGNHDTILGPIAKKKGVEIADRFEINNGRILVVHGHKEVKIPTNARTLIIGHEHPAVSIREGQRQETFKCFLKGRYKSRELIVIPSMNLATEGTDVLKEELLSPFLQQNLDDFEVFVVSDKVYNFGKLKNLRKFD